MCFDLDSIAAVRVSVAESADMFVASVFAMSCQAAVVLRKLGKPNLFSILTFNAVGVALDELVRRSRAVVQQRLAQG